MITTLVAPDAIRGMLPAGVPMVIAKVTVVLLMAGAVASLLQRASSSMRHIVWLLGLSGALAVGVASAVAPSIVIPVSARFIPRAVVRNSSTTANVHATSHPADVRRTAVASNTSVVADASAGGDARFAGDALASTRLPFTVSPLLLVSVWAAVCVVLLLRCVLGHYLIARIVSRSAVADERTLRRVRALSVYMGVARDVRVRITDSVAAPVTSGIRNPVILLPTDAMEWDDERMTVVVLHELAHIARLDYGAQLVATIATAVFWFHPLAWYAAARLRAEAEIAADDAVLNAGIEDVSYAAHLLEVAKGARPLRLSAAVAVGMARSSHLERRLQSMLNTSQSRRGVSRRVQIALTLATVALAIPLAGMRFTDAPVRPAHGIATLPILRRLKLPIPFDVRRSRPALTIASQDVARAGGDSVFERTIAAASGGVLLLDLKTGGDVVLHATNESQIRMRAHVRGRYWRDTEVSLEKTSNGVLLKSAFAHSKQSTESSHSFDLWVPKNTDVAVSSAGGGIHIYDVEGTFTGHTGRGEIVLENVNGAASLATGGGEIRITDSHLDGHVSTGGGSVSLNGTTGNVVATAHRK